MLVAWNDLRHDMDEGHRQRQPIPGAVSRPDPARGRGSHVAASDHGRWGPPSAWRTSWPDQGHDGAHERKDGQHRHDEPQAPEFVVVLLDVLQAGVACAAMRPVILSAAKDLLPASETRCSRRDPSPSAQDDKDSMAGLGQRVCHRPLAREPDLLLLLRRRRHIQLAGARHAQPHCFARLGRDLHTRQARRSLTNPQNAIQERRLGARGPRS
jgi:hypothetical protein